MSDEALAQARRLHHHALHGGTVTHGDVARLVNAMERVQAQVAAREAAARREGIEAAAAETDCGCAARPDVLARLAEVGHKRASYLCSHGDACCALQAAAIRALLPAKEDGR